MVSDGSSSAEMMITDPFGHGLPPGQGLPVDTCAAMSMDMKLFPSPGLPHITEIRPSGIFLSQSHSTSFATTSAAQVRIARRDTVLDDAGDSSSSLVRAFDPAPAAAWLLKPN